jgi:hypothetical protein
VSESPLSNAFTFDMIDERASNDSITDISLTQLLIIVGVCFIAAKKRESLKFNLAFIQQFDINFFTLPLSVSINFIIIK